MSETIPGGRQRTASEGDILDYDNNTTQPNGYVQQELLTKSNERSLLTSAFPKSNTLPKAHLITSSDTDHDSNTSGSTLERKSKSKLQPFKAVKKSVARMVRQAVWSVSSGGQHDKHDGKSRYYIKAIVTPTFGRKTKNQNNQNLNNNVDTNLTYDDHKWAIRCNNYKWPGDVTPGTVGLNNHGNTCFMNAVLQCLSNTDLLTEYFVTEKYKEDLLKANAKINSKKFGTNGEITKQIANVLHSLWTQSYTGSVSEKFKSIIGKCNNQYFGTSQHDAQEFLLWLLDKLHEDLSLVLKKKAKPVKSASPCPDDDPSSEMLPQSKSFVYNLFQALHRSSLTCPNCKKNSNTFDPYVCVSLPLPLKSLRPVYVTVVMTNSNPKQVKIALSLDACGTISDLRSRICADTNIPQSQLLVVQYYDDGWRQTYRDNQPLSDIPDTENVYAIELLEPPVPTEYNSSLIQIVLVNVERYTNPSRCVPFCTPEVIQTARDVSYPDLQALILQQLAECLDQTATTAAVSQGDEVLFDLRVVDSIPSKCYLSHTVDMPLYTQTVDEALCHEDEKLPPHLKVVVEWTKKTRERLVVNDNDYVKEHSSVHQMRLTHNQVTAVSLDECFDLYTREEKLSGDDAWLCPYCKKQQLGTIKKLGLWSLPDVFVVHLKRFRQVGTRRNKLNTLVNFPVNGLDMSRHVIHKNNNKPGFMSPENRSPVSGRDGGGRESSDVGDMYDLYAVCNHYGNMHGGHYTAFCKSTIDQKWYRFDDSNVRVMLEKEVTSGSAYILFYQRRTLARQSCNRLESGQHWIFHLSKAMFSEPVDRVNKPLPPSPKKSPSHGGSPGATRRGEENEVVSPRGRQAGVSTLPRARREHSAPPISSRTPQSGTATITMHQSPRLRRHGSERRSEQSLSRLSWARMSGELRAAKGDTPAIPQSQVADEKVPDQNKEASRETVMVAVSDRDCVENMSVNLPPSRSPNPKLENPPTNAPKSILKTPSGKFETLPRQKSTTPDKCITISVSKSAHELSRSSYPPNKSTSKCESTLPRQPAPTRNHAGSTQKSNQDSKINNACESKYTGTVSSDYSHSRDNTVFAVRHANHLHGNSPRSSSGSEGYISARHSSGSEHVSPRSSHTSSPKSPHLDHKTVRISADDKQTAARSLFTPSYSQQTREATSAPRIVIPGTAYTHPRPPPRPYTTVTNSNHSFWDKPAPEPAPPVFNPFKNKKKPQRSDTHRYSADSHSLDRYSHVRINTGVYDNQRPPLYPTRGSRAPARVPSVGTGDDSSCLKESSV